MTSMARGRWASDLEDIAMEAWIVLDRVLRREQARNLDALMTRIARFTFIDAVRRLGHDPIERSQPIDDEDAAIGDPLIGSGIDPSALEMVRFCTLEYFTHHRASECIEVARHWFAGRNHAEIGRLLGEKRDAIAKRWERCRRRVVEAFRADLPGPLRQFATELEEVLA